MKAESVKFQVILWTHAQGDQKLCTNSSIKHIYASCDIKKKIESWGTAVCIYEKWLVCFWQVQKRNRQMACSVWRLAGISDQEESGTEGRETEKGNKLFHSHTNWTQSPAVNATNSRMWIGIWERSCWTTLCEMLGWLIVFQWKELGVYTLPANVIYQPSSIFNCDCTDTFYTRRGYRLNWQLKLFLIDVIDWKKLFNRFIGVTDL